MVMMRMNVSTSDIRITSTQVDSRRMTQYVLIDRQKTITVDCLIQERLYSHYRYCSNTEVGIVLFLDHGAFPFKWWKYCCKNGSSGSNCWISSVSYCNILHCEQDLVLIWVVCQRERKMASHWKKTASQNHRFQRWEEEWRWIRHHWGNVVKTKDQCEEDPLGPSFHIPQYNECQISFSGSVSGDLSIQELDRYNRRISSR